jgi:hypothetical protein
VTEIGQGYLSIPVALLMNPSMHESQPEQQIIIEPVVLIMPKDKMR